MPSKSKVYAGSKFTPETIEQGLAAFTARLTNAPGAPTGYDFSIVLPGDESWTLDSAAEFYAQYRGDIKTATIRAIHGPAAQFAVQFSREREPGEARVFSSLPTRADVEAVFEVFEAALVASHIPYRPTVFIGHGHAQSWRELKDYLRERQHLLVQDFNTDPTAGYGVTEVLDRLTRSSSPHSRGRTAGPCPRIVFRVLSNPVRQPRGTFAQWANRPRRRHLRSPRRPRLTLRTFANAE